MNMIPRSILLILCLFSTFGWAAQTRLDMPGLIKMLLAQGYHDIREVELEGDRFEVSTLNAREQKVRLSVDAYTGEITQQKEAD
ncbi:PepSY domain-containing protein [Aeromonas aquatica]|uniref:PepSY domain-containing protein n=1 Tax=Aeromonas aquatica TaxID=558964 RepID=UPI00286ECD62|nr:PepSY domain-containing protein [Aeromonas aquatica]